MNRLPDLLTFSNCGSGHLSADPIFHELLIKQ